MPLVSPSAALATRTQTRHNHYHTLHIPGLPPLAIFMSEFLVVTSTFARAPWLAIVLVSGILIGVAALFLRLNTIAFGEPRGATAKAKASYVPMFAHLALVFVAGIYMPPALVAWFQNVARLLG